MTRTPIRRLWTLPLTLTLALAPTGVRGEVFVPLDAQVGDHDVATLHSYEVDSDHDGLSNGLESLELGTDPLDPDTDGDGWADGPVNLRYSLLLAAATRSDHDSWTTSWDCGGLEDEFYVVADGARWPAAEATSGGAAVDGSWILKDERTITPWIWLEHRTVPIDGPTALVSRVELWEDDFDLNGDWATDDLHGHFQLDLLEPTPLIPFEVTLTNDCGRFVLTLVVVTTPFADPAPLDAFGDSDDDGLTEADEAALARELDGMVDPMARDLWLEVDQASDVDRLEDAATVMLASQFRRHGITLRIDDGGELLEHSGYLDREDLDSHYATAFTHTRKGLFRYVLLADELWSGQPSSRVGDALAIAAGDMWFEGDPVAQAGVLMHELGHALGLQDSGGIDRLSSMNPLYRHVVADYEDGSDGGLDEWGALDLGYDLPLSVVDAIPFLVF